MFARSLRAVAALAVVAAVASGCSGSPAPAPSSPTPLTDEQAFAAAEETYRAYVDALNQVDLSDPATFEPVYALTTGDLNESDRKTLSQMHADGWLKSGDSIVTLVTPINVTNSETVVAACVDVSAVTLQDSSGQSTIDGDRPTVQRLQVTLVPASTNTQLAVASAVGTDTDLSC